MNIARPRPDPPRYSPTRPSIHRSHLDRKVTRDVHHVLPGGKAHDVVIRLRERRLGEFDAGVLDPLLDVDEATESDGGPGARSGGGGTGGCPPGECGGGVHHGLRRTTESNRDNAVKLWWKSGDGRIKVDGFIWQDERR